jgi:hypothetical protein
MKMRLLQSRTRAQKGTWKSAKCGNYSDPQDGQRRLGGLIEHPPARRSCAELTASAAVLWGTVAHAALAVPHSMRACAWVAIPGGRASACAAARRSTRRRRRTATRVGSGAGRRGPCEMCHAIRDAVDRLRRPLSATGRELLTSDCSSWPKAYRTRRTPNVQTPGRTARGYAPLKCDGDVCRRRSGVDDLPPGSETRYRAEPVRGSRRVADRARAAPAASWRGAVGRAGRERFLERLWTASHSF